MDFYKQASPFSASKSRKPEQPKHASLTTLLNNRQRSLRPANCPNSISRQGNNVASNETSSGLINHNTVRDIQSGNLKLYAKKNIQLKVACTIPKKQKQIKLKF